MFYQQPPAGNPICLNANTAFGFSLEQTFTPYKTRFYASATAALAATLIAAKNNKPVDKPEVLFPAYGCPDLISAARFAGVQPVLVDLEHDRPWMSLNRVATCINEKTVGVVAVDLFGISERLEALRTLALSVDAILIEDSAQGFPANSDTNYWQGDLVVVSFGRGKPVSLLGGGAVLHRGRSLADLLPQPKGVVADGLVNSAMFRLKSFLYNKMLSPYLYWIPQSIPFLHLGETQYHPLNKLGTMDTTRQSFLPTNIVAYQLADARVQRDLSGLMEELNFNQEVLIDLPKACQMPSTRRLLRYPLLVNPVSRTGLYKALLQKGLGPSKMYSNILPSISGLENIFNGLGSYPEAESFASRILTFPTHAGMSNKDIILIRDLISEYS